MDNLVDLEAAIAAQDWPCVLGLALDPWRETRGVELADLIELAGARLAAPAPRRHAHLWWIAPYDPLTITARSDLADRGIEHWVDETAWATIVARQGEANPIIAAILAHQQEVSGRDGYSLPRIERMAAAYAWPDDPRLTSVFADWLYGSAYLFWRSGLTAGAATAVCRELAARLVQLADWRLVPHLGAQMRSAPSDFVRDTLRTLARRRPASRPDHAALLARARTGTESPAVTALWAEVVARPDELEPRIVLGDALAQLGDSRGELIGLMCMPESSPGKRDRQIASAIQHQWKQWLGDLAPIVTRTGTEFRRGMLHAIRVGHHDTPRSAYAKARGHRELRTVQEIRPHHVEPGIYGELLASLPHCPPLVGFDCAEAVAELVELVGELPITVVEVERSTSTYRFVATDPRGARFFDELAILAPKLERLRIARLAPFEIDRAQIAALPEMFPALRAIEVDHGHGSALADLPLVELRV